MTIKIIGAVLVVAACGGFGFSLATKEKFEEKCLQALLRVIEYMLCELEYHQPPLPDLCRMAGSEVGGIIKHVFNELATELDRQLLSDAGTSMKTILRKHENLPIRTCRNLLLLGQSMGRFSLSGQLSSLRSVAVLCKRDLESMALNQEPRLRSYRTLGICCGIALVIIFL